MSKRDDNDIRPYTYTEETAQYRMLRVFGKKKFNLGLWYGIAISSCIVLFATCAYWLNELRLDGFFDPK